MYSHIPQTPNKKEEFIMAKTTETVTIDKADYENLIERIEKLEKTGDNSATAKSPEELEAIKKKKAYLNEKVRVKIRRDGQHKDDVYVAVNGKGILIKRGEWVEIPRKYALLIERNQEAEDTAFENLYALDGTMKNYSKN